MKTARALAYEFHKHNVQLVYGGGTVGLMGEIARTLVSLSGPESVHGIIPKALVRIEPGYDQSKEGTEKEQQEQSKAMQGGKDTERTISDEDKSTLLQEKVFGVTTIVPDMHTRKRMMATKVIEGGLGLGLSRWLGVWYDRGGDGDDDVESVGDS